MARGLLEMKQWNKAREIGAECKYFCELDNESHIHLTYGNQKIGQILNISTLAGDEPLARKDGYVLTNVSGTCGGICELCKKECYARKYTIRRNNTVIPSYNENTLLLRERPEQYFKELKKVLEENKDAVLRAHVSGEFETKDQMEEHCRIGRKTGNIQYFYTKRFKWLEEIDNAGLMPDNVRPSVSIWHNNYDNPNGFHEFVYDDGTDPEVAKLPHCPAVNKMGRETGVTCDKCNRCINAKRGMKTAVYAH